MLIAEQAGQYPRGAAAAILLSLQYVSTADDGSSCRAVMDLLAALSPAGVRRSLMHAVAAQKSLGRAGEALVGLPPEVADRVLGRLAGTSLVTFSVDGSSITVHRLVMRVIRESLAARGALATVCAAAADALDRLAGSLTGTWHQDRLLVRDLVEQIMARVCQIFCARGFLLSGTGCLSGVLCSRYLMPWCPVYPAAPWNRAYRCFRGQMLRVPVFAAFAVVPGGCCLILRGSRGGPFPSVTEYSRR
jgi:hypothetical protein